jgi:hypothetical protein
MNAPTVPELRVEAMTAAVLSHAIGIGPQGHDLRLRIVEAASSCIRLPIGAHDAAVEVAARALRAAVADLEGCIHRWAEIDPDACRAALLAADARLSAALAKEVGYAASR